MTKSQIRKFCLEKALGKMAPHAWDPKWEADGRTHCSVGGGQGPWDPGRASDAVGRVLWGYTCGFPAHLGSRWVLG